MNHRVTLQLTPDTFSMLYAYLHESGSGGDVEELASAALKEWVGEARKRAQAHASTPGRGYQWKSLFLPSGSHVRMYYEGKYHYAQVEDDDIVFNGRAVSPAQFANKVAGGTRNAWRDLWLRFPGEPAWKLASVRRRQALQAQNVLQPQPGPQPQHGAQPQQQEQAQPAGDALSAASSQSEAVLRRLALLLEQSLEARGPQYRRRSDFLDKPLLDD